MTTYVNVRRLVFDFTCDLCLHSIQKIQKRQKYKEITRPYRKGLRVISLPSKPAVFTAVCVGAHKHYALPFAHMTMYEGDFILPRLFGDVKHKFF